MDRPEPPSPLASPSVSSASGGWLRRLLHPLFHLCRGVRLTVAAAALTVSASAAPMAFDIPAQGAADALQQFRRQAKVEVLFPAAEMRDLRLAEVKGTFEPADALEMLLAGTGFEARETRPGQFAVSALPKEGFGEIEGSVRDEKSGRPVAGAKVDLLDSELSVATDRRGRFLLTKVPAGVHTLVISAEGLQKTRVTDIVVRRGHRQSLSTISVPSQDSGPVQLEDYVVSAKKSSGVIELDPYDVYGNRARPFTTGNLDLTRTREDPLPFQTFSAKDIEMSGAIGLQEFLQTRLPQNFNAELPEQMDGGAVNTAARRSRVDLRGWGANETVFLLNGRRMPPQFQATSSDVGNPTPNLGGIPIGAIERIEILSSAGSAIYGASATGGVINVITRRDYEGGSLQLTFESPSDVMRPRWGVDVNYGMPVMWGMGLRLAASYSRKEPLSGGDRADVTVGRYRQLVMEREPTRLIPAIGGNPFFTSSTFPPSGTTPNVRAANSAVNLFSAVAGATPSNFTTMPAGYTGGPLNLSQLQPGVWNLDLAQGAAGGVSSTSFALDSLFGTTDEDMIFSAGLDKKLGGDFNWTIDFNYSKQRRLGQSEAGVVSLVRTGSPSLARFVPAAAPINPFGVDMFVLLIDPNLDRSETRYRNKSQTWSLSSTLNGSLGEWRGFIDFSLTHSLDTLHNDGYMEPIGGWVNAVMTGAYNPFVDPRVAMPAANASFYDEYIIFRYLSSGASISYGASAKASGPLYRLPAGDLTLTSGLEWSRVDRYRSEAEGVFIDSVTGAPRAPFGYSSTVAASLDANPNRRFVFDNYAVYAETTAPLLGKDQSLPLASRLEVFLSGRLNRTVNDGFRLVGQATEPVKYRHDSNVYAYGMRYDIVDGVAFRGSQSVGFRPPSMSQVTPSNPPISTSNVTDRRRGNQLVALAPSQYITGGNPLLTPETTTSTNYGIILTPRWVPRLRLSVDYVENVRDDFIASLSTQQAIDLEAELPGRVTRGPADGHPSGVGPITFVDARQENFRQLSSKSMDFSLDYEFPNVWGGRLLLSGAASRNISFKVQTTNTTPPVEQIGNPTAAFSRQIEWNGNLQARWEGRRWTAGWTTRYFDDILARPNNYLLQGDDRAHSTLRHDLVVSYRIPAAADASGWRSILSRSSITVGVKNVFDRDPRFWAADASYGIAPYDSIMGRSILVQIRKEL